MTEPKKLCPFCGSKIGETLTELEEAARIMEHLIKENATLTEEIYTLRNRRD